MIGQCQMIAATPPQSQGVGAMRRAWNVHGYELSARLAGKTAGFQRFDARLTWTHDSYM
jgi:hypothetical protein